MRARARAEIESGLADSVTGATGCFFFTFSMGTVFLFALAVRGSEFGDWFGVVEIGELKRKADWSELMRLVSEIENRALLIFDRSDFRGLKIFVLLCLFRLRAQCVECNPKVLFTLELGSTHFHIINAVPRAVRSVNRLKNESYGKVL